MQIKTQSASGSMAQNSEIGVKRLSQSFFGNLASFIHLNFLIQLSKHPSLSTFTQGTVVRKRNIAEKINTARVFTYCDLAWMQLETQVFVKKILYFRDCIFQKLFVFRYDNKIVRIANIIFYLQLLFHKLIKLIHVDISKKLRRQVTDRESFSDKKVGRFSTKTFNDFFHKPHCVGIFDFSPQELDQNGMVNAVKKLSYVALKCVRCPAVVSRNLAKHFIQNPDAFVRSFSNTTRKGVGYKSWFKNWVKDFENCVVQHSVSNCGFVDVSKFWVVNIKIAIRPMLVGLAY